MKKINPGLVIVGFLLLTAVVPAASQGTETFDLNGSWVGFYANGTNAPKPGTIRQTGNSVVIDNGEGSQSNGRIEGNRIIAREWNLTGTIVSNGRRITWSNDTMWILSSAPPVPIVPSLTGIWSQYNDDGRVPIAIMRIRQTGASLTAEMIDQNPAASATAPQVRQTVSGRVEGTRFSLASDTGTIEPDGNIIRMANKTYWARRKDLTSLPDPVPPTSVPPTANLEQQCFQMIQGKVAWNRAGTTNWDPANIQKLCQGTTNPSGTIACFQNQIRQHDQWGQAIAACAASSSSAAALPKLAGSWRGYYEDGSLSPFVWAVAQTGNALTFQDIGAGSNRTTTARLQNAQNIEADWGTTGRLAPDGKSIRWSDKTTWVLIPNLNGSWIGYYEDGSKSPFVWVVRQQGATVTLEDIGAGSGQKGKGRIESNRIIADDWNLTATISSDGQRITWSNGTFWTPQKR